MILIQPALESNPTSNMREEYCYLQGTITIAPDIIIFIIFITIIVTNIGIFIITIITEGSNRHEWRAKRAQR